MSGTAAAPAANEVIHHDNDCINRILKAVQERAIPAAEERTRLEVTRTLKSRFDLEMSRLQAAFDRRLIQVAAEAEALAQLQLESMLASARDTLRAQIEEEIQSAYQAKLDDAAREWRNERQLLWERIAATERALDAVK